MERKGRDATAARVMEVAATEADTTAARVTEVAATEADAAADTAADTAAVEADTKKAITIMTIVTTEAREILAVEITITETMIEGRVQRESIAESLF